MRVSVSKSELVRHQSEIDESKANAGEGREERGATMSCTDDTTNLNVNLSINSLVIEHIHEELWTDIPTANQEKLKRILLRRRTLSNRMSL